MNPNTFTNTEIITSSEMDIAIQMDLDITLDDLRAVGITKASRLSLTYEWIQNEVKAGSIENNKESILKAVMMGEFTDESVNIATFRDEYGNAVLQMELPSDHGHESEMGLDPMFMLMVNAPDIDTIDEFITIKGETYKFECWNDSAEVDETGDITIKAIYKHTSTGEILEY